MSPNLNARFTLVLIASFDNHILNCRSSAASSPRNTCFRVRDLKRAQRPINLRSSLSVQLELKTYEHLQASRRTRADRMSKKRRAQIAHGLAEVNVIENVKRIHCHGCAQALLLIFLTFPSFGCD